VFGGHIYTLVTSSTIVDFGVRVGFVFRDFFDKVMYAATGILMITQSLVIVVHLRKDRIGTGRNV
jgi:hypothetical protein